MYNFAVSMFPSGTVRNDGLEVNGLQSGTEPQGVTILSRWKAKLITKPEDRREFFLVTNGQFTALMRICTAMEGSGYDEYVAIRQVVDSNSPAEVALVAQNESWKASLAH